MDYRAPYTLRRVFQWTSGEARNPKPETRMNAQNQSSTLRLRPEGKPKKEQSTPISGFGFGASFGFRVSGFWFTWPAFERRPMAMPPAMSPPLLDSTAEHLYSHTRNRTRERAMGRKNVGIALLGCGVVGGGVVSILLDQRDLLRQRTGLDLKLRHVIVRDTKKADRRAGLPIGTDCLAAIPDPAVDIVVELIGGTGAAAEYVQAALKAGKSVVTANKSLLAARGPELFRLARKHNACIAFEASCGGGIPIINALQHGLIANRIDALVGIVNGTCNFILTQMTRHGWSYNQALAEAQR